MADEADRAADREQQFRDDALASAREQRALPLIATGRCYNCSSSIHPGVRFCDSDCRNDYDQRKSAESRRA